MAIRKNLLIIICIVSSLLGLLLIYIAARNIQPVLTPISEITTDYVGRAVTTSGYIAYKSSHPNGHIFLTIKDDEYSIQVPLFSNYVKTMEIDKNFLKTGAYVEVTGLVDEYKGNLQIVPRDPDDIKIYR